MASRTRRAKVVLAVLACAIVGLGVWAWEPVYWWVMTTTRYSEGTNYGIPVRTTVYENRWSRGKRIVGYYVGSGYKAYEYDVDRTGQGFDTVTAWHPDGIVQHQEERGAGQPGWTGWTDSPPWLRGVTDQTAPSMPAWMKDDAKWQAALDAQE